MRPEDRPGGAVEGTSRASDGPVERPLDPRLDAIAVELAAAGAQARRAFQGRTQPTRVYGLGLRAASVAIATGEAARLPRT